MKKFPKMTSPGLLVLVALFLVAGDNLAFFRNVLTVYPVSPHNLAFLLSLPLVLTAVTCLCLLLLCCRQTLKPVLIGMLLVASVTGYFMNTYNTIIDVEMVRNSVQTSVREAGDLFSWRLLLYFLGLGVAPALAVWRVPVVYGTFRIELWRRLQLAGLALLLVVLPILGLSKFYASFFREHKELRYYTNPLTAIYSLGKYAGRQLGDRGVAVRAIGEDARIPASDTDRELVVLVVGEAARADHFSLNGYRRDTNPLLAREDIINFKDLHSCGTSTAVSVPCMFSVFGRDEYSDAKGRSTQNVLDILSRAGVHVLWRDNNSDSKGVALRVQYEDYQNPAINPVCDVECRDEGMLVGLQAYIDGQKSGDILIVLHQMGNHGPAYYKRYPAAFEKFVPVCRSNQLEECGNEEIVNAYDNAILYSDYFLAKVIALLKDNDRAFETALFYLSDHGESLGENGLYLHGLPYFVAPEAQTHVGAVMWFGKKMKVDRPAVRARADREQSQDNLFHTLLGIMEVETSLYDRGKDVVQHRHDWPAR